MIKTLTKGILIITLLTTTFQVNAQNEIIGTWQLNSYGYSTKSGMNFSFIKGVDYHFEKDMTGYLIQKNDTTRFEWKLKRKKLTISFPNTIYQYKVVQLTISKLMIVDKNPGKDENKSYIAYEKGLIFEKKN